MSWRLCNKKNVKTFFFYKKGNTGVNGELIPQRENFLQRQNTRLRESALNQTKHELCGKFQRIHGHVHERIHALVGSQIYESQNCST